MTQVGSIHLIGEIVHVAFRAQIILMLLSSCGGIGMPTAFIQDNKNVKKTRKEVSPPVARVSVALTRSRLLYEAIDYFVTVAQ